ncbi:ribosomal-protein-alanine acetyltransferase [Bacillus cereus BAG1X2-3]|uniref:GNAT family N-acetyltransferase n=1 Tax=Bacillus cereus TaxID=1396 RepID=UPI00032F1850|nr:GNAT family N-acetyltransferase [Bacillus cereus]EOO27195.1 ribosomal-protein-alanine acetyltransferase [Bacillus cereus BAG1X1-1]EOO49681.1 ribosomal-protein-alanine acetyltransferase [Bacillus cereus BAG1X2-1]EOO51313.1 ribosomal-protein-alanine acetyltransferase [Bacillus cereus BAG1X2-2]EOO60351.1 ribosomal-protein-alanine acetyltransferase [Bacillus cereus BAG1X2-3]EOP06600.1 ribosomal-protein-alanine acetyltransferase [Bacillus cereus BAG2O-1]
MAFPILETERLRLVEIEQSYCQKIYEIFSLDEVTCYYGMNSFTEFGQASRMIESFSKNYFEKKAIRWGIVLKETNVLIGTIGLNNLQLWSKRSEIGYDLHPRYWGNGYTSEAVREIIDYGFKDLGLFRIGAITYPENVTSCRMLSKIGFQKEGLLRGYIHQGNKQHDALLYSIVRTDIEDINL